MSEKEKMMNGTFAVAAAVGQGQPVPAGDPNIIRALQHFLTLAQNGQLTSVVVVGVDANGNVMGAPIVQQHPAALHILNGALFGMMRQIDKLLDRFRSQQAASPIIKPGMFRPQ